ncbi:YHYH protein [Cellulophaga baltica]|uniref:YHYH protein n=1 Tax=Cellulophaga TaxID=104264 RepID=UPI001C079B78|nr:MULTISPECIES: YHYH protein [Cellulophaga]MBU2994899.1 YHYH protein [Cellulophaga baltica]MDO6766293.1 YHYH protein [Cellulophaga sp. 1_MG-2023]
MGAQLKDEFINYCIECLPEYVSNLSKTYLLPITPVKLETPINFSGNPQGGGGDRPDGSRQGEEGTGEKPQGPPPGGSEGDEKRGPSQRGVAFNGVAFDAPAPLHIILKGYTIPPIDDAGGHINLDSGYHYHAATGKTKEEAQNDHHAPMIGYAMDSHGLYGQLNEDGKEPDDLDDCRGHYDEVRGYHYHVDAAGNNNIINCFSGATASK